MKYLDEIEAYWEQRMTPEEQAAFEEKIGKSESLRAEMRAYEASMRLLEMSSKSQLENKRPSYRWLGIAAAVLLVLGLCLFGYANFALAPAQLADKNYQQPLLSDLKRSASADAGSTAIYQLFSNENYPPIIEELDEEQELSPSLSYLLAHAYYNTDSWQKAQQQFTQLLQAQQFQYGARRYLALTLLQAGDTEGARQELETIYDDQNSPNRERAGRLLKKIDTPLKVLIIH